MSGIAGMMYFDEREPSKEQLTAMLDVMKHRGPDEAGMWSEPGIGLAVRKLGMNDAGIGPSPAGNEDGSIRTVFSGMLYNHQQLREELIGRGHTFRSESDSEVIVHMYEEYGEECVHKLRGTFGFVIWDRRRRVLFGARDHFGIRPIYYVKTDKRFAFASEIKSLLQLDGMRPAVRMESFANFLTFQYVPDPDTMFEGIRKLPPAHMFRIDRTGRMQLRRYWEPSIAPSSERSFDDTVEEVRERLKDSVKLHLQNASSLGCFLSSGIDSTAVTAMTRSVMPIKTFSVGFAGANDETKIAAETAKAIGTEHYSRVITDDEYFASLGKAVWHQDEPVADPSAIALYHAAKLAKEHADVVLSGEGADELFGGYLIYREPLALSPISWMPSWLKRILHQLFDRLPAGLPGRNYVLRGTTPLERRFLGNARIFSEEAKEELLAGDVSWLQTYRNPWHIAAEIYERTRHLDPVSRMQIIDLNLWMPGNILMKADKMTMAHSLEVRMPFLDKEVFELARQIPASYRIAGGTTKYVLRKAMEGVIPDFILNRPKLGFPVPLRDWLKGERGLEILEQVKSAGMDRYIQIPTVEAYLRRHRNGEGDYARRLWTLYIFALWHQAYAVEGMKKQAAVS